MSKRVTFVAFRDPADKYEFVLRIKDDRGNYAGVGSLNGAAEAEAVVQALNAVLAYVNDNRISSDQAKQCCESAFSLKDLLY